MDLGDPPSLEAVALDTGSFSKVSRASVRVSMSEAQPPRRVPLVYKAIVGVVFLGCVGILVACTVRVFRDRAERERASAAAVVATPAADVAHAAPLLSADAPVATVPIPAPEPPAAQAPPDPPAAAAKPADSAAATATLRVAHPGTVLIVDGKKVKGSSAVVTCGAHMVAIGKEKAHRVDAPCGKTVVVDAPAKPKRAKAR